jgi:hypothetical protein
MAARGTTKHWSLVQEERIATVYRGKRSKSSGAAAHDQGDVRTTSQLIECKYTGAPGEPLKNIPKIVQDFEKIAREAWAEGRDPLLALRYYHPESILADGDGWVDLSVRRTCDDIEREEAALDAALEAREYDD